MYAFHVTWAAHNSRISERMKQYNVQIGHSTKFSTKEEIEITRYVLEAVKKYNVNVMAYNICSDHVHMIIVCGEEERDSIINKLKSYSSRKFNLAHGYSKSILQGGKPPCSNHWGRGKTQHHLWQQKYNWTAALTDEQLSSLYDYVTNNRIKHNLPDNQELSEIIKDMIIQNG